MEKKRDQKKRSAITPLTNTSSKNSNDKRWNSVLKSVNKSFSSGLSADFGFIFWRNHSSSKFNVLSVIGNSKRALSGDLDKKLIPAKWTKKNGYNTLISSPGKTLSAEPRLIRELRKSDSDAMLVPISSGKKLKGFIFTQNSGNNRFTKSEVKFVESMASILAIADENRKLNKITHDLQEISVLNPNLIMKFDSKGKLLYHNPAVENLLKSLKLKTAEVRKILPSTHNKRFELSLKNDQVLTAEAIIGDNHFEFQYTPIPDDNILIVLGKDVTDRQDALNKLLHSQSRLVESNEALKELYEREKQIRSQLIHAEQLAALGQMGSKIAHELNNPLQVISACAEVISDMVNDDDVKDIVKDMNTEIQHIISLASGYMRLGKPSASNRKNINVNIILRDLVGTLKSIGHLKTTNLKLKLSKMSSKVYVDRERLDQVFRNLILNALQAMQGRKIKNLTISTRVDKAAKSVVIVFSDSGSGIPKKYLNKIFDPFVTTKSEDWGTGIGLLIVKDIVETEYSGKVNVTSVSGKGTSFTVSLPVAPVDPYTAKILIVDDEPMLCQSYNRYLTKLGYLVKTTGDAKEGLKIFEEFIPDVIIADIQMPGMDGFQFAERIWEKDSSQKIIFSSGFAYVDDIKSKLETDNLIFFKKPARLVEDLLHSVEEALKN